MSESWQHSSRTTAITMGGASLGTWEVANSEVDIWAGREGMPSIHLMARTNLNIRKESEGSMYGKVWFLPFLRANMKGFKQHDYQSNVA